MCTADYRFITSMLLIRILAERQIKTNKIVIRLRTAGNGGFFLVLIPFRHENSGQSVQSDRSNPLPSIEKLKEKCVLIV